MTTALDPDRYRSRVRGCLLGGAIGDALGAPVEFLGLAEIHRLVGEQGVREYLPARWGAVTGYGLVTDDTQMTLFTAEGIIRGMVREDRGLGFTVGVVDHAYRRWLDTQLREAPPPAPDGWLAAQDWLYSRRAPGTTCLTALQQAPPDRYGLPADNDSKGCGGVMRSAPFGLVHGRFTRPEDVFEVACQAAGFTHGHPTGQVASGALAHLVWHLVAGRPLPEALDLTLDRVDAAPAGAETASALRRAREVAGAPASTAALESLGQGWVAEEALAIAVYAALCHPGPDRMLDALALAVTHSGDSDSTGSLCGNILGALHGESALPAALAFEVEGRGTILQIADDLVLEVTRAHELHGEYGPHTRWSLRYPGM